jgi:hypothetical protein
MTDVFEKYEPDQLPLEIAKITKKNIKSVALWCNGVVVTRDTPGDPDGKKVKTILLPNTAYAEGVEAQIGEYIAHDPNVGTRNRTFHGYIWTVLTEEVVNHRYRKVK